MHRIVHLIVAAAVATGIGATTTTAASAAPTTGHSVLSTSERAQVKSFFDTYGVARPTQEALFRKIDAGQLLDSYSGADPVATKTLTTLGEVKNVYTYADGSLVVTSLQVPIAQQPGTMQPMTVGGCSVSGDLTRTLRGCKVEQTSSLVSMAFYADYQYTYWSYDDPSIFAASIQSVYSPTATVVGGSFSGLTAVIARQTAASSSLPALARASMTGTNIGGSGSRTCWVQLNVPIGSYSLAYTTFSF